MMLATVLITVPPPFAIAFPTQVEYWTILRILQVFLSEDISSQGK